MMFVTVESRNGTGGRATRESWSMSTPPPPSAQPHNPLHSKTLEAILTELVLHYGWDNLLQRIALRCFRTEPSIGSSLGALRQPAALDTPGSVQSQENTRRGGRIRLQLAPRIANRL